MGPGADNPTWLAVLGSPTARSALVKNVLNFTVANNFNGITLDWEWGHPTPVQRSQFTSLVKEFYIAFHSTRGTSAYAKNLTIGIATGCGPGTLEQFDMKALAPMLDRVEVMGYYGYPTSYNKYFPEFLYSQGVKPSQIILGLGFSSSPYTNVPFGSNSSQPGSPRVHPGWVDDSPPNGGPYTTWGFNQVPFGINQHRHHHPPLLQPVFVVLIIVDITRRLRGFR